MERLPRSFYTRSARQVAADLLGKRLVRLFQGQRISGMIVETEAYCDTEERDLACHGDRANKGRPTPRTQVMFGQAGFAYVYFTYGIHWMFNVVTGLEGQANAVLIRALQPLEGLDLMRDHRQRPDGQLTNGPAKLAQALAIDKSLNGEDLCNSTGQVWIEDEMTIDGNKIATGPRIGLGKTPEPWFSIPWRFWIAENRFVSK